MKWFEKAEGEKKDSGRNIVLLITKRDRKSPCVWLDRSAVNFFEEQCGEISPYKYGSIFYPKQNIKLYGMLLEDWFKWVSPGTFMEKE